MASNAATTSVDGEIPRATHSSRSSFARNRRGEASGISELHLLPRTARRRTHCNQLQPLACDSRSPMPKHPGIASDVGACNLRNVPGTAVPKTFGRLLTKFRRFICSVCRPDLSRNSGPGCRQKSAKRTADTVSEKRLIRRILIFCALYASPYSRKTVGSKVFRNLHAAKEGLRALSEHGA